jgi:glycosyltransferase involved in cell wall biosynthesis
MKILFLSPNSAIGGAESVLLEDIITLHELGHEINLIVPSHGRIVERLLQYDSSIKCHEVRFDWWITSSKLVWWQKLLFLKGFWQSAKGIKKIIKSFNPDVVITNTLATPVAAWAASICEKKHIWYIHELVEEDHNMLFMYGKKNSFHYINKWSHQVITNSELVKNKFLPFLESNKNNTFYYSVDIPHHEKFFSDENSNLNQNNSDLKLVMSGRVSEGKRQEDAIKAVEILINEYDLDVQLTILGDRGGSYSEQLKNYIQEKKLTNYVTFVDFTENIYEYYKKSDFMLVCSLCEAFGRVTIEAMKLKKVVFAARSGANSELIGNNERGILYEVGNAADLAEKIYTYRHQRELLQNITKNAYQWSWQVCNKKTHIENLLNVLQHD